MNKNSPKCDKEVTAARKFSDQRSWVHRDSREFLFGKDMMARRREIWERTKGFCEMPVRGILGGYCNRNISEETMECDHIESRAKGGGENLENLRGVCRRCHVARHGRYPRFGEAGL